MTITVKTLLCFCTVGLRVWAQDVPPAKPPPAKPEAAVAAPSKLATYYFRVAAAVWTPDDARSEDLPVIQDGTEKDPLTRTRNAQPYFAARGVEFPPGSSVIYHEGPAIIAVTNTPEQVKKIGEWIGGVFAERMSLLQIRAQIVEFRPDLEDQLTGRMTFAALQTKLGDGLKTVCVSTVTTKSGNRVFGELDRGTPPPKAKTGKPARAQDEAPDWPPPPGTERAIFECEPQIGPTGNDVDMNISLRYAAPAIAGRPSLGTNFATNVTLKFGAIFKARTFTVADPKQDTPRYFAILLQCEMVDATGKTTEQARGELFRK